MKVTTISVTEFKAKCLAVMDEVARKREPVVITKRGKPVARLVPVETADDEIFGFAVGRVKIVGDIVGPVFPLEDWEMLK